MVDENLSHELSGNGEEVSATLPLLWRTHPNQAKVRFMHERGALQRVIWSSVAQLKARQAAQFLVDARKQNVERFAVSVPPTLQ
jgi:hypothetical protein